MLGRIRAHSTSIAAFAPSVMQPLPGAALAPHAPLGDMLWQTGVPVKIAQMAPTTATAAEPPLKAVGLAGQWFQRTGRNATHVPLGST